MAGSATLLLLLVLPASAQLTVVSTTSVLWEPIQYIGGTSMEAIYLADPTICPHMQSEVINNRIQLQREFIANADIFVAHNYSVDNPHVMPFVEEFMMANGYGEVQWTMLKNPAMTWNTPENAKQLAAEVTGWISAADPNNATIFEERYQDYCALIDAADLSSEEREKIAGQDVIVMVWQRDAAEKWLGLNVVNIYAPEFYQGGKFTPAKLVDDIHNNTEQYRNVKYIIENMQSGELAKGVEEALHDQGIPAERVIFTNFPKSLKGIDTIPDVLVHNKALVTPSDNHAVVPTTPQPAPLTTIGGIGAICIALILLSRRC
jgi:zinc/manganese transport system substrate-binding protein